MAIYNHQDDKHNGNGYSSCPTVEIQTKQTKTDKRCGCLSVRQWSKEKRLTTICLFLEMTAWGMFIGVINSSMLDLELITRTSTTQISFIWTAFTVGSAFMGPIGGLLLDKSDSRLYLGICQICAGVLIACLPLASDFIQIIAVGAVLGIFLGLLDVGRNITAVKLWGWDGAMWLQFYHFIFALGSAISPLFTKPFLAMPMSYSNGNETFMAALEDNITSVTPTMENITVKEVRYSESQIQIPFGVVGGMSSISGIIAIIIFVVLRKSKTRDQEKKREPLELKIKKQKQWYVVSMVVLLFFRFCFSVGIEVTLGALQMTFLVKGLGWTKADAVMAVFTLRISFAVMRAIGVGLATFITPTKMMFMDIVMLTTSFSLLWISGLFPSARWIIWLSTCLAGSGVATFYSASMSWAEKYLQISGRIGGFFLQGSAAGVLAFPPLGGFLFEEYTPWCFVYVCMSLTALLFITTTLSTLLGKWYRKNYPSRNTIELPDVTALK